MLLTCLSVLPQMPRLEARGVDAPHLESGRCREALGGQTPDSPALRGDECVAHVQDAHVRVALHVLLPVHVVVLDHICRPEGTG